MAGSMASYRQKAQSSTSISTASKKRKKNSGPGLGFWKLKVQPQWPTSTIKAIPVPNTCLAAPFPNDQAFKYMSLLEPVLAKPPPSQSLRMSMWVEEKAHRYGNLLLFFREPEFSFQNLCPESITTSRESLCFSFSLTRIHTHYVKSGIYFNNWMCNREMNIHLTNNCWTFKEHINEERAWIVSSHTQIIHVWESTYSSVNFTNSQKKWKCYYNLLTLGKSAESFAWIFFLKNEKRKMLSQFN